MLRSAVLLRYTIEILQLFGEQKHEGRSMIFHEYMYHNMRVHVIFLTLPQFYTAPYYSRGIGMLVTKQTL